MGKPEQHDSANGPGDYIRGDEFDEKLLQAELERIQQRAGVEQDVERLKRNLFGLAFSGGGIRSATFSLGVMQALAEKGWLKQFHYLSTVSGGGYIGSSLTWLLHRSWRDGSGKQLQFDVDQHFPYARFNDQPKAPDKAAAERDKYDRAKRLLRYLRQHSKYLTPGHGISMASLLAVILRGAFLSLLVFGGPLVVLMGALSLLCLLYNGINPVLWGSGLLLAAMLLINIYFGIRSGKKRDSAAAYDLRRRYDKYAGKLLWLTGLLAVLGTVPLATHYLELQTSSSVTAAGIASSIYAIMKSQSKDTGKIPLGLLGPLAATLFIYGILLVSYLGGVALACSLADWMQAPVGVPVALLVTLFLVVVPAWLGWYANINHISIHRYYRDRLMELFLPDIEALFQNGPLDRADLANGAMLSDMCRFGAVPDVDGPYHIINSNMVTKGSSYMKLSARGGDNFIFSPLYCGNAVTGWRGTAEYMAGMISLPTAMAISGAAADPHGAPGGEGLLRNVSVGLLMALFNVRLGYWAVNPARFDRQCRDCSPNWFMQGWRELTGSRMDEKGPFVHLADGGHFENLAVYELIRRRVKTIVVCDGGADADYSFSDFSNLVEKVRVDFGVDIIMDSSFLKMCPKPRFDEHGNLANPYAVATAEQGYIKGNIRYDDGSIGTLVYIKTTMIEGLPKDIYGYKSGHADFPDETTADQFFDEKQFEAYRELGYRIGLRVTEDKGLEVPF
ncbi:MAG: hypothetical protein COW18_07510 [Zetaproteobacteria bacterium CG12_big_fil_rev_8_21_14_0_65_54_13]|nr:MAG: hypothetical protein COX55_04695 [Zetaproteobacteria bacterium CG23_combo_of_CG06-09_8_20_14_all_54_7]PIW48146.1 MAG: hypothetical protein COW18_07510 [Zetaproteobacteria bacterium CG12_big_fil_rev_8_21_14_0_65_54_13]PIX55228.1 MAG: hypothetical protein COZ50_03985 [Zetaproteobacteria bacterium CG_4_10_14_3_um_filter_54_28]PJA28111.1 MAG: hypothetical protein CO188_10650 [Zetaproteobacteria bacterium CG_4_9_14_3_um_filter_54_145]